MMEAKHTPGPWLLDDGLVYALDDEHGSNRFSARVDAGWAYYPSLGRRLRTSDAEIEANARLIAAAPDLLEAAQRLLTVFGQNKMTRAERIVAGISDAGLKTEGNAAIEALSAAIAKASPPTTPVEE